MKLATIIFLGLVGIAASLIFAIAKLNELKSPARQWRKALNVMERADADAKKPHGYKALDHARDAEVHLSSAIKRGLLEEGLVTQKEVDEMMKRIREVRHNCPWPTFPSLEPPPGL